MMQSTTRAILATLLTALLLSSASCVQDRNEELQQRISSLGERIARIEPPKPQPIPVSPEPEPRIEQHFTQFDEIKTVSWEGVTKSVVYKGQLQITETAIGNFDDYPDGLMFHPDGRIAYSRGGGTSPNMRIAYWNNSGKNSDVVAIKHASLRDQKQYPELSEENGYLWFFGGPATFDADGVCYFSLGMCGPNGLYKVISDNPTKLEKLCALRDSTNALQAVPFDADDLYSSSYNGIFRFPRQKSEASEKEETGSPWFQIQGDKLLVQNTLIISPTKVIVQTKFRKPSPDGDRKYKRKTLFFDKTANAYWSLSIDEIGPMAISWDGKRQIRFDRDDKEIREFQLQTPTD